MTRLRSAASFSALTSFSCISDPFAGDFTGYDSGRPMLRSHPFRPLSPGMRLRALRTTVARVSGSVRRALRLLWTAPPAIRVAAIAIAVLALWGAANWIVQAVRKPSEMFFPVGGALVKTPLETWRRYGPLFREHSTAVMTPELLAALAQIEGAGNPVARPRWTWRPSWNPFELYRPASSAVGMFHITDAAFRDAKRYCVHDHTVVVDGALYDPGSWWFNSLYTRVVASHGQRCGAQHLASYLAQVNALKRLFARLAAGD